MTSNGNLFDTARQIDVKLQSPDGAKTVTVRFPTDEEWVERQRRRKIIIKNLGRGMSETLVPETTEVDDELVAELRVDDKAVAIDGYEATKILEQIGLAEVDDVIQEVAGYRVKLRVPGTNTSHLVRMPTAKEIMLYRRAFARMLDLPYNKQQLTVNLSAADDLYTALAKEKTGYAGAVPIIHKVVVVKAAIDTLESDLGVSGTENF